MINGKTVIAVIPARGGSKGVIRKNIRIVAGKPLIAWTIEAAKKSKYIDRLILSSDDPEIIKISKDLGCEAPFVRPLDLARDTTPGMAPVIHALQMLPDFDYVSLLQPTSPLRLTEDIDGCIEECINSGAKASVSVVEAEQNPYWMFTLNENKYLNPLVDKEQVSRRQDLPKVYVLNGAVYVAECEWLIKEKTFVTSETIAYLMPNSRSLDIDTEEDITYLDFYLKQNTHQHNL